MLYHYISLVHTLYHCYITILTLSHKVVARLQTSHFTFTPSFFGCTLHHGNSQFPNQGSNLCPCLGALHLNHWMAR